MQFRGEKKKDNHDKHYFKFYVLVSNKLYYCLKSLFLLLSLLFSHIIRSNIFHTLLKLSNLLCISSLFFDIHTCSYPPPGHLPNPRIESKSPALLADSLPSEPPAKPKNTGVGSFFKGPSLPRNRTGIYCIAGGFFTGWATRESWFHRTGSSKPKIAFIHSQSHTYHFSWILLWWWLMLHCCLSQACLFTLAESHLLKKNVTPAKNPFCFYIISIFISAALLSSSSS